LAGKVKYVANLSARVVSLVCAVFWRKWL